MTTPSDPDTSPAPDRPAPGAAADHARPRHPILRLVSITAGVVLVIVGLITWPMPIPVGFILTALGVFLLARDSVIARNAIRRSRERWPALDRTICRVAAHLPHSARGVIRSTAPEETLRRLEADQGETASAPGARGEPARDSAQP
ncbi:PGPGW domain-containing protein [Rhodospira trueperi]|nr:PGPGW domain-containing protein [Rhodospira trueperi]